MGRGRAAAEHLIMFRRAPQSNELSGPHANDAEVEKENPGLDVL